MKTYCVSSKMFIAKENSSAKKTNQNRLILLSNCVVCGKKKSTKKNKEIHNFD